MAVVMVVDDDAETRATLTTFLTRRGHRVNCASQGKEAIEKMTEDPADVVILDAVMPNVDGEEFLEVLRCYLRWQHTPVIMITAYEEGSHIKRAVELGVRKTFLKGDFDLEEMGNYVDSLASRGPASDQPGARQPFHCN